MFGSIASRRVLRSLALLALSVWLAACSSIQPIAQTSSAPVATTLPSTTASTAPSVAASANAEPSAAASSAASSDAEIMASIQGTLDTYVRAYNENDPELLAEAVDPGNAPLNRFFQTRFDTIQASIFGGQTGWSYTVLDIKPRDLGFVQATVERVDGAIADWTFREVDGRWVMSEPKERNLGKKQTTETDNFIYFTYPWADEINPKVMELMENARQRVLDKLGKAPEAKAEVLIKPIFGLGPPESANALAYYRAATSARSKDRMVISAPQSYVFPFYDPAAGWERDLEDTLTHEFAHLVQNRLFTPAARMSDWMSEGFAEYVADSPRPSEVRAAVQSGNIIPLVDRSNRVNKQDLQHLTILTQDISLAYGLSYELVAYINEQYGGMDGWWKFADAYDRLQNLDKALQEAFGIGLEQFESDWHAWLNQKYS